MSDRLTIVGPEPDDENFIKQLNKVNIEALMLMAKYDGEFRTLLVNDREKALEQSGIAFSPAEKMIMTGISAEKLISNINEFHVPGINRGSLGNWRKAAAVIILITSVLFTAPHCQRFITRPAGTGTADGWHDSETYVITAIGIPSDKLKDIEERKKSARRAAILNAQYMILEKFMGSKIEAGGIVYYEDAQAVKYAMGKKEIIQIIKNGTVIRESYDDEQNCEITYTIHGPDLKKKCEDPDVWR